MTERLRRRSERPPNVPIPAHLVEFRPAEWDAEDDHSAFGLWCRARNDFALRFGWGDGDYLDNIVGQVEMMRSYFGGVSPEEHRRRRTVRPWT